MEDKFMPQQLNVLKYHNEALTPTFFQRKAKDAQGQTLDLCDEEAMIYFLCT